MKHLIVLAILLLTFGLAFTVLRWKAGLHMTFSQHAAASRTSKIFYALLFLITLPIFILFLATWYVPTNHMPKVFLWLAATSALLQIVCTWIPEAGGTKTIIHRVLTGISGIALLPLIVIIAMSSNLSVLVRVTAWIMLVVMMGLLSIALRNQKGYRYALLLQIGYYVAFFITILVSTYF